MRGPSASRGTRRGAVAEANMTPMIDVVFLLIIFFLVSSHLARRETRLDLALPTAATGQADNDPSPRLTINVESDGALSLGSTPVDPAELTARLVAERDRQGDALRVRLRSDEAAPYSAVEPALVACSEAGVDDLALAVFRREGAR
ncbi:Biopolymer transport protein ExbD [Planctomycetes bacterium MalM25]|nr:Biopolymer transport protein ExbD [Planctomycetes bacterium MalM25]